MTEYSRGAIVWANLNPVKKGEQGKNRPCVIISHDAMNHSKHPCLIILPITGKENVAKQYPTHVLLLQKEMPELEKDSVIMCEQIRAISKSRVNLDKPILTLGDKYIHQIESALMKAVDI